MPPEKLEERRRASAAHVRSILDNTLDGVLALDDEGGITFWNPQAEQTFGWSRAEAVGAELAKLALSPESRPRLRETLDLLRQGAERPSHRLELEAMRSDGTSFPLELTLTSIPEGGAFRFSAFARNITARREAETERERLLSETEKARTQAETASRAKDEFLAALSHELRTPLTAIVGWTYLLREGQLDAATTARGLEAIERNASAQARVISDIIDLSRIVGARFRLNVRPVALATVAAAALEPLMRAATAKELKVQTVLDPEALVSGDPDRLRQVAWHLVSNAIKFTPQGGRVTVRVERRGGAVHLVVEDTGEGIDPAFLPHVFERFRQADQSNTRSYGGLGLGLAVVRHLVELHGGTVSARSPGKDRGTTFGVALPVLETGQRSAADTPAAITADTRPLDGPDLRGARVLVVAEAKDLRDVVSAILDDYGAEVLPMATAGEALRALPSFRPGVLLTQVEMGVESGLSLIRKVRALPLEHGGGVPAAALTAYGRTEDRVEALRAGFDIHLTVPVQPAELLAVVARLSRRAADRSPAGPEREDRGP